MKPCLYTNCLSPKYCTEGRQECHINAYANAAIKRDLLREPTGRTYERVCIGLNINEIPVYEQIEK